MINFVSLDTNTQHSQQGQLFTQTIPIRMKLKLTVSAGGCFLVLEQHGVKCEDLKDLGFHMEPLSPVLTCCTSLLPPLRMEIPSLRVEETMAPGSPGIRQNVYLLCQIICCCCCLCS